jgi:hypothetical protein
MPFVPTPPYARADILQILGIPDHKGGPWFIGYTRLPTSHSSRPGCGNSTSERHRCARISQDPWRSNYAVG